MIWMELVVDISCNRVGNTVRYVCVRCSCTLLVKLGLKVRPIRENAGRVCRGAREWKSSKPQFKVQQVQE